MSKPSYEELKEQIKKLEKIIEENKLSNQKKERMEILFENAPDGIYLNDLRGNFLTGNKKAEELIGFTREELENKSFLELNILSPKYLAKATKTLTSNILGKETGPDEFVLNRKDGTQSIVEICTHPAKVNEETFVIGIARGINERDKHREDLEKREDRFWNAFRNAGIGMILAAPDGTIIDVNKAICRIFGYSEENLKNKSFEEIILPEYDKKECDDDDTNNIQKILNGINDHIRMEKKYITGDGKTVWTLLDIIHVKDSSNNPLFFIGQIQDITNLKNTEQELSIQKTYFEELFENSPEAIVVLDNDNMVININKEFSRMFGFKPEETVGYKIDDIIAPTKFRSEAEGYSGRVTNGQKINVEAKRMHKNGNLIDVSILGAPIKDERGQIGVVGNYRDISKRKKAERIKIALYEISKALNNSDSLDTFYHLIHESLKSVIDTTNFYISIYHKKEDTLSFDYFADEQDSDADMMNVRDSKSLTAEVILTSRSLMIKKPELIQRIKKGKMERHGSLAEVWIGIPLKTKHEVIGVLAVQSYSNPYLYSKEDIELLESVSEQIAIGIHQKRMEEERLKLQEQLFQSQKMDSIGRLAGGIAHDFNNILVGIMGYSEMLGLHYDNKSTFEGEAAHIIHESAKRAKKLTMQLLGFAREGKYNPVPLNINKVILESVQVCKKILEKNIGVEFILDELIDKIEADKNQIEQVLTNMILNARDAMPEGGKLCFKTENVYLDEEYTVKFPEMNPGKYVKVVIVDRGTGISKEIIKKIFDPFFTTKEEGKGTGLGLAMVYGIVKNHKGHVDVVSEQGRGTEFTIYLPVTEKEIDPGKAHRKITLGEATILVVDDEEDVRMMTKNMIEYFGYKVYTAEDGNEALDIFNKREKQIDLVLLDILMPGLSWENIYESLKNIRSDIKVVLMSGNSRTGKAKEMLNRGMSGFIQKPFELSELSDCLSRALNS